MKKSKHAAKRMTQRAISDEMLTLITTFGDEVEDSGGIKFRLSQKRVFWLRSILDRCVDKVVITDKDGGTVITAYSAY